MKVSGSVAVVTGAGSGIGRAIAGMLGERGAAAVALVDVADSVQEVAKELSDALSGSGVAFEPMVGDATDADFRTQCFDQLIEKHGRPTICVPAAGITRDALAVKVDKETGKAKLYPVENFRLVLEINLVAPTYWALEMIGRLAEARKAEGKKAWQPEEGVQGVVVMIGSVSSDGNKGQISYAATKRGLVGVSNTIAKEAMFHGVKSVVVHPGYTGTPMVKAMGDELVENFVKPNTQLKRLIEPDEIADAVGFCIGNDAVFGEIWPNAGWHPQP